MYLSVVKVAIHFPPEFFRDSGLLLVFHSPDCYGDRKYSPRTCLLVTLTLCIPFLQSYLELYSFPQLVLIGQCNDVDLISTLK